MKLFNHESTLLEEFALGVILVLACTNPVSAADKADVPETRFTVNGISIDISPMLKDNWRFSSFRSTTNSSGDITLQGVALQNKAGASLERWYAYDKDGVIIDEGPLGYQEYPRGEKTRFDMYLGKKAGQVQRIKIDGK
jgi:hypothetical protein